jgi:ribosomal protein S18 acetylase RimI-like enzyme
MKIRLATIEDLEILQSIAKTTFSETFAHLNSAENMQKYLTEDLSREQLRSELLHANSSFYLAEKSGTTIGYLKLNEGSAYNEVNENEALEIERIYLLKPYHGKGAGKKLLDFAFSIARQKQKSLVWLGVWEENHRAIAFYRKHGFTSYGTHIFRLGNEDQVDVLMKLELNE